MDQGRVLRSVRSGFGLGALTCALGAGIVLAAAGVRADDRPRGEAIRVEGMAGPYGERLTLDDNGLTLTFPDEIVKLRIGGRVNLDYGAGSVRPPTPLDPFLDDFHVRRTWIESYLTLDKQLLLGFQYDLADPDRPINDALIVYRMPDDTLVSVGNEKEPFSADQMIGNVNLLFLERSLGNALVQGRTFGVTLGRRWEGWTAVTGVFGGNPNTGLDSEGIASTTRLTYAPIAGEERTLHLGLAGSYREFPRDRAPLLLSSQTQNQLFRRSFFNTMDVRDAASAGRVGAEIAYRDGPLLVMAEYIRAQIGRFGGARPLSFQGGYVQASLVLNGENRPYEFVPDSNGTTFAAFGAVPVKEAQRLTRGGFGVFELGARVSSLDLDEAGATGGTEHDVTFGLSWYPDTNIRITTNYIRTWALPSIRNGGPALTADSVSGRFQLFW